MNMDFSIALVMLKSGYRVRRRGWNGKGMWLGLVSDWTFTNGQWDNLPCAPFVAMKTADDNFVPWLASQADILAADWEIVRGDESAPAVEP